MHPGCQDIQAGYLKGRIGYKEETFAESLRCFKTKSKDTLYMLVFNKISQQCLKNDWGCYVETFRATTITTSALTIEQNQNIVGSSGLSKQNGYNALETAISFIFLGNLMCKSKSKDNVRVQIFKRVILLKMVQKFCPAYK